MNSLITLPASNPKISATHELSSCWSTTNRNTKKSPCSSTTTTTWSNPIIKKFVSTFFKCTVSETGKNLPKRSSLISKLSNPWWKTLWAATWTSSERSLMAPDVRKSTQKTLKTKTIWWLQSLKNKSSTKVKKMSRFFSEKPFPATSILMNSSLIPKNNTNKNLSFLKISSDKNSPKISLWLETGHVSPL